VKRHGIFARIILVILAALLALPIGQPASPVGARNRSRTITRTFGAITPLVLPTEESIAPVSATVYPSSVEVSGLKQGRIRDVNVRLSGLSHTDPEEVDVLLVGPAGQTAVLMADVGGFTAVDGVTLRLDDEAAALLPDQTTLQSGVFRPINLQIGMIPFNVPAPDTPANANAALTIFDGSDPNGTWSLFVQDSFATENPGVFAGGWELEITARVKTRKNRKR
jgi:subtilisin-like proprotein convertase family protein